MLKKISMSKAEWEKKQGGPTIWVYGAHWGIGNGSTDVFLLEQPHWIVCSNAAGVLYAQNISAGDNEFILFGKFSERNLARIMDDWDYKVRDLKVLDKKIKALKISGDR